MEERILELDRYEYGTIINIINEKRSNLLKANKDAEYVSRVLKKVIKAPTKPKRYRLKNVFER